MANPDIDAQLEILISKERLQKRIVELAQEIKRDYQDLRPVLIGTLKGCFAFLTFLALELDFDVEIDFISARSYGHSDRTSGRVDLFKNLSIDVRDRHVLLVEDIVDSGLTLRILLEDFQLAKPKSVAVVALLNKRASHHIEVPLKYVGFDIEDDFVVGFGLDFSEKYRNLPYIAVLNRMNMSRNE